MNHAYYYQTELQIELSGAEFGYLYNFAGNRKEGMLCHAGKSVDFIKDLKEKLLSKFITFILLTIVSKTSENETPSLHLLYCTCRKPKFGRMIRCDNMSCKIRWYHYPCIQMKREPQKSWFCKNCRISCT